MRTARPGAYGNSDRRSEALARPRSPDGAAPPRQHHPQRDGQDRACPPRHPSPLLPRPPSIGAMPQTSRTRWCRSILRDHLAMSSHPEGLCAPPPSPAQDPTRTPHHATGRCLSEDSHGNLHLRKRVFASVSLAGARCRRSCKRYALRKKKKRNAGPEVLGPEGWPGERRSSDLVSKLSLGARTSVGPPTEFEPPARLGEAPARQAVLKRHAQARAHARRTRSGHHQVCTSAGGPASTTDHHTWPERSRSRL